MICLIIFMFVGTFFPFVFWHVFCGLGGVKKCNKYVKNDWTIRKCVNKSYWNGVYLDCFVCCCCWPWFCIVSVLPFVRLVSVGLSRRCMGEAHSIWHYFKLVQHYLTLFDTIWHYFKSILHYLTLFQIYLTLLGTISHFRFQLLTKISSWDSTPNIFLYIDFPWLRMNNYKMQTST